MSLAAFNLDDFGGRGPSGCAVTVSGSGKEIVPSHGDTDKSGSGLKADVEQSVFFKKLWWPLGQKTLVTGFTHTVLPSVCEGGTVAAFSPDFNPLTRVNRAFWQAAS